MKILTAAEMREVDRLTIERGIPGIILMENAGCRVVDYLLRDLPSQLSRVVVVCGKGNNGGDGFVIARQLFTRKLCAQLTVWEIADPGSLTGDARLARQMLAACGCPVYGSLPDEAKFATLVIDAILGTGLSGPASGPACEVIRTVNQSFLLATKVAVDLPSGLPTDETNPKGEYVRVSHTVSFTAAKPSQVFSPSWELMGKLKIEPIGTPDELVKTNSRFKLRLTQGSDLSTLFAPRVCNSNKGLYGHVLVVGGSFGKSGAPAMAGLSSFRTGAGLVTVAVPESILTLVASYRPELMTEPLDQTKAGRVRFEESTRVLEMLKKMTVLALGPGLGLEDDTVRFVKRLYAQAETPAVIDADALNALAGDLPKATEIDGKIRILTPHPGEMGRLISKSTKEVQSDRLNCAQQLASDSGATIVLKGDRTVIAFPDGESYINPTGSPAMATGGTGDILTGMVAGFVAQHVNNWKLAVVTAVWLHGRCGELASAKLGDQFTLATDILEFLPEAMNELRPGV